MKTFPLKARSIRGGMNLMRMSRISEIATRAEKARQILRKLLISFHSPQVFIRSRSGRLFKDIDYNAFYKGLLSADPVSLGNMDLGHFSIG